jgi:hypothetical protein
MRRRALLALGAAALLGPRQSRAQPSPKRVIWVGTGKEEVRQRIRKALA